MARALVAVLISVGFLATANAQVVATARAIRTVVIVEQARGDSAVITTVPPGVVIEILGQRGDWYQVRLPGDTGGASRPAGWVHRDVVELLPSSGGTSLSFAPPPPSPVPSPVVTPPLDLEDTGPSLAPGTTELIISGSIAGWNAAGETITTLDLSSDVGFVVTSNLEVLVSIAIAKASGVDMFGSLGGGIFVNFADDGPIIPFVGSVVGRGFGTADALGLGGLVDDPFFVHVSGGFRVMTPGGGGALIVRPFYERLFNSSAIVPIVDLNRFGVSLGGSILF